MLPALLRLAWPNILVMAAQSSTGLIEMWFVARLGSDALAGMALVLPVLVLMQSMSQGAVGGGISSAIARALGSGRRDKADDFVIHALVVNVAIGLIFSVVMLPAGRLLYRALGGSDGALVAAMTYSNIIFGGVVILLWLFNALGSIIRGTGNMFVPGVVFCGGAVLLIPLSPALIFGWGPFPRLGIAGGGIALFIYYGIGTVILGWYVASGRNLASFRMTRIRWELVKEILSVGAVAAVNTIQINFTIAVTMGFMAAYAGPDAVAGFGIGTRLEYLMPPISFGLGAPLVALVGTNIGANQSARALRIALVGGAVGFVVTETIGATAAIWPNAWLTLFTHDPHIIAIGSRYLRTVGPFYGFFGLGISMYFASQGAGRLGWPLMGGLVRMIVAVGGGWIVLHATRSTLLLLVVYASGMLLYGLIIASSVAAGTWFGSEGSKMLRRAARPQVCADF
ncbi:MATE family efflux transporter [Bradyrhizobium sp. Tv2a-2]|uniref:MATE family efflux transporter n=1 Tax=Bradyrhizobium sp. Tv2a-2 TaxID=113395 RepID=UPI001FDA0893|nr:MATE family efflux transporter [Bradyrhizobium sp. Tv2a-2]